jgi:hypothetical protein
VFEKSRQRRRQSAGPRVELVERAVDDHAASPFVNG